MNFRKKNSDEQATVITNFSSISSEAVQKLQTNISFASIDKPMKVIGVTSSVQSEGKSTLIVNMANVYAFRGASVCLVNLDLRRPSIHHFYHIKNEIGIEEYVSGEATLDDIIVHIKDKGVDLINSGTRTPFTTKILASPKLKTLFDELRKRYDYVLVDTAPVLLVTDAMLCAQYIDGYVFACAQHVSKKKNIEAAIKTLQENGIGVIGLVVTQVTDFGDGEANSYSSSYYYGPDDSEKSR